MPVALEVGAVLLEVVPFQFNQVSPPPSPTVPIVPKPPAPMLTNTDAPEVKFNALEEYAPPPPPPPPVPGSMPPPPPAKHLTVAAIVGSTSDGTVQVVPEVSSIVLVAIR
jgi:hypothetical protein